MKMKRPLGPSRKYIPLQELQQIRRTERMEKIDALSPEMRALVHEYGWSVVNTLITHGITRPKIVRHIVETILDEFSPTRGAYSKQGIRTEVEK